MTEELVRVPTSKAIRTDRGSRNRRVALWGFIAIFTAGLFVTAAPIAYAYIAAVGVLTAANTIRFRRQARRFIVDNNEGIAALARGDLSYAHDVFWGWAGRTKLPGVSALARHNLAWTLMRQGEHQQAIAVLVDNEERNHGALKAVGMFATSAVDLALDYALIGNTEEAQQWLDEAGKRTGEITPPTFVGMQAFTQAVLDCRTDRCAEAAHLFDEGWAQYEGTLTGETLRPMRIVRAFAIAASGPRNAGVVETTLAAARPAYPGEFDFLGKAWPEMESFLIGHQLKRTS